MKRQSKNYLSIISLLMSISFFMVLSCQKEFQHPDDNAQCTACNKRPPVADAGPDQVTSPPFTLTLDGSKSSDPDNNIVVYKWTKISGPTSFSMLNENKAQAGVANLTEGIYQFELKVTDAVGLYDKDTIQIEVRPGANQQSLGNVCFYFPDPTGTISFINISFDTPVPNLITVKINNLSAISQGVWGKNYLPSCPFSSDYYIDPGGNCVFFNLPPGTYNWSAESAVINMARYPYTTPAFIQYFLSPHKVEGSITVKPGDNCIIQKIVFL